MSYMTKGEKQAIAAGEQLELGIVRVSGRYASGVPFEREYTINVNLRQGDNFYFDFDLTYPEHKE
jgi:hypothetical protein